MEQLSFEQGLECAIDDTSYFRRIIDAGIVTAEYALEHSNVVWHLLCDPAGSDDNAALETARYLGSLAPAALSREIDQHVDTFRRYIRRYGSSDISQGVFELVFDHHPPDDDLLRTALQHSRNDAQVLMYLYNLKPELHDIRQVFCYACLAADMQIVQTLYDQHRDSLNLLDTFKHIAPYTVNEGRIAVYRWIASQEPRIFIKRLGPDRLIYAIAPAPLNVRGNAMQVDALHECSVCLQTGSDVATPCGHLFHKGCLQRWLAHRTRTCPNCRMEVPFVTPVTLRDT
jgi:hypothetical protein